MDPGSFESLDGIRAVRIHADLYFRALHGLAWPCLEAGAAVPEQFGPDVVPSRPLPLRPVPGGLPGGLSSRNLTKLLLFETSFSQHWHQAIYGASNPCQLSAKKSRAGR